MTDEEIEESARSALPLYASDHELAAWVAGVKWHRDQTTLHEPTDADFAEFTYYYHLLNTETADLSWRDRVLYAMREYYKRRACPDISPPSVLGGKSLKILQFVFERGVETSSRGWTESNLIALCDDGNLWSREYDAGSGFTWKLVPGPQASDRARYGLMDLIPQRTGK